MKIRFGLMLLAVTSLLTGSQSAGPACLVSDFPDDVKVPIRMSGSMVHTAPVVVDKDGTVVLLWRGVSGALRSSEGGGLVSTLFFLKVAPDGTRTSGTVPKAVHQMVFSIIDKHPLQAAEMGGAVPDGTGGVFYQWGPYAMRISGEGKSLWPAGDLYKGKTEDIWRFPGKARMLLDRKPSLTTRLELLPDGMGNAIVVWPGRGLHAQKFSAGGRVLWGDNGVVVDKDDTSGSAVADGRGGLVALVHAEEPYNIGADRSKPQSHSLVRFLSPQGIRVRDSAGLAVNPQDAGYRIAPDGKGGILILETRRGPGNDGWKKPSLHLLRVGADARVVFDRVLATDALPTTIQARDEDCALQLFAEADGTALVSWRVVTPAANPDAADPTLDMYFWRIDANGRPAWPNPARLRLPARVGSHAMDNTRGKVMLTATGAETVVVFEHMLPEQSSATGINMNIFVQRLNSQGVFTLPDTGRRLTPNGGAEPWLLKMNGRPAVIFWDTGKTAKVQAAQVPYFLFL